MTEILLDGCRTRPLLSYLKAFGVLAAVAEQLDAGATGSWRSGRFVLTLGAGSLEELVDFFVDKYSPPPILSPWNSRGGFRTDRGQSSEERLAALEASTDSRLAAYRKAIEVGRYVWAKAQGAGLVVDGDKGQRVDEKRKAEFVRLCRSLLPDDALGWLDAAVVLVEEEAVYPALLGGTGGNLGSGDLSSNAHEAVLWMVKTDRDCRQRYVVEALTGAREGVPLFELLPGQFDPAGTGGVNMGPGEKLVNPIDFLLGLHGASLFASGVARRLAGRSRASVPFEVNVSPGVVRTMADGEKVRAELWLPEWRRPMTLSELRQLLAEGRAQWSGKQSTSSLDFARAAASLGVDRDIAAFDRYLIVERHGQANLAVPVGRFEVRRRRGVELTSAIDPFLERVGRISNPTQAVRGAASGLCRSIFDLANRDTARNARAVLVSLHRLERAVGRSSAARDKVRQPFSGLRALNWFGFFANETSPEFRVAAAIASQRDAQWRPERGSQATEVSAVPLWCRPVHRVGVRRQDGHQMMRLEWSEAEPVVDLLGPDPRSALREGWRVRALRCAQNPPRSGQNGNGDEPATAGRNAELVHDTPGIQVAFDTASPCPLEDIVAYGLGSFDDEEFAAWLEALVMLDWTGFRFDDLPWKELGEQPTPSASLGPVFATNAPFFKRWALRAGGESGIQVRFHPISEHVTAVARGDGATALRLAAGRLRQYGIDVPLRLHPRAELARARVLDAALVPMFPAELSRVIRTANPSLPDMTSTPEEEIA
ncbi:type I-G CRISPR-associated protein Cas8g1/Csx17 [Rhabdothermincola sediminis]|uniref:type I-G CRISPR-associated protein Cas8g1/Csx17 n=1 Tax=Rhabdothermincola sediminis TaxID=2751370 RepID=UPI001AA042DB|nr:type I-U CRISPR-associated protein Csx17 [Rhabdothermincola sediminis]